MTRITRIVAKGFKSFGKRTELEFTSNFSCVLGPNGSGKSNIMDAICFVLGKGSAKGLRADKSANLIYNGGKLKNPAKDGEVSIYFDNSKKVFPVDEDYVKITRVIRQSGQSVYKINDKTRTRQEILDLLSVANIDPDGYNIVLQGDIVKLVEMAPVERRKIVEDIAGISVYEEKKDKTLTELSKADEKINEAEIILAEREAYLKELKKDRDHALKYREITEELNRSKATLCHSKMRSRSDKKEDLEKSIAKYAEDIKASQKKIESLKKDADDKKKEIKDITLEIEQKGEKEQVQIMKDIESLKISIATNKTRISSNENELARVTARKEQLAKSLEQIESKIAELATGQKKLETEKQQALSMQAKMQEKIQSFRQKHKMEDSEGIESDIDKLDKEIEDKQKDIQVLREQQQELMREKDKNEMYITSFEEKIAKVKGLEKEHKLEIENLKLKRDEFKKTTLELNQLLTNDSSLAAQLGNARQSLNSSREKHAKLNARNITIHQKMGDNIAVKSILESKNQFGQTYGTVADLGEVESKYAAAMKVAAGPRIKSIVVDSDQTASNCIKHLKQYKLGIATFLPLNKIKSSEDQKSAASFANANGVHGFAIDLVHFDPKYRKAFSYVFGNTIVIDNIDVARRVGIGNIRMVTLDGDLVETSGAMHGGFRQKEAGTGFQEKELTSDLRKCEKEVADMESLVSTLEEKKSKNEDAIQRLREFKSQLEGDIIKMEKSLHLDSDDLGATLKEKKELEERSKSTDKDLFDLQQKLSSLNRGLAECKITKQQLRDRIAKLKNPTVLAELNAFEQKVTELRESMIKIDADMRNKDMQLANILKPEKENITKIIQQHDKEESRFSDEMKMLVQKTKDEEQDLKIKEKLQKEFYGKYKELFVRKDRLNELLQKTESQIIKSEEQARGLEQRMNILSIDKAGMIAELSGLSEEYLRYKDVALLKGKTEEELKKDIWSLEKKISEAGNVNMRALEVYDQISDEYQKLIEKRDRLKKEREDIIIMINEIETKKKDIFMVTFDKIDQSFRNMFQMLSTKGDAFLELEDPEKVFDGGLRIKVRISGKKFLDIRSLSGGEKTLTGLAFIFAIQEFEPASFYVLDEVDAALDKRNSEMLSSLIKKYSSKAQYIVISHKDGVIGEADTLYGVSMDENGMSKVVSLKV